MSWTKKSANGWLIAEEYLTIDKTGTDQSTSYVDFIPYGKDWYLQIDPSGTFASGGPIDMDICYESGGTYWELCTTGLSVLAAGTTERDLIDNSAKGNAPFFKFRIDKTATMTATSTKNVKFTVIVPPKNGVVY